MKGIIYNLLLIDDDIVDRARIVRLLKKSKSHAFYILEADNVLDGLAYYLNSPADCILLDYIMPRQDGLDFIKILSKELKYKFPAIVVITAQGDENTAVSFLKAGALDYLKKEDLTTSILIKAITTSIKRKKADQKIMDNKNRLTYDASHDALTNLFNRRGLEDAIKRLVVMTKRHDYLSALLFCDLDKFKHINDSMGHHAGDLLLQKVAARLKKSVRKEDLVARVGGDEFVILLENMSDRKQIGRTASKLCKIISVPFYIDSSKINMTISIGIVCIPTDTNDCTELLKKADSAMYSAKISKTCGYAFHDIE